jgi:sugar/nucleoside kinase (ribokinase family)
MPEHPAHSYDYVTVGHVTVDVLIGADGSERRQPGGGAFYSGLQAARLGLRTLVLTRGDRSELAQLLAPFAQEIDVEIIAAPQTTTLQTRGRGAARAQRVLAWAGEICADDFASAALPESARILHLAPVARETPPGWPCACDFMGLTAQGLVRRWDASSSEIELAAIDRARLPGALDAAVISASERACCEPLFDAVPIVAVTAGEGPTTIHLAGGVDSRVAPQPVNGAHDDLGAGDVFAAAFFIALRDGLTPFQAAARGNAAATVRIGGQGPGAIGDLKAIEQRLRA